MSLSFSALNRFVVFSVVPLYPKSNRLGDQLSRLYLPNGLYKAQINHRYKKSTDLSHNLACLWGSGSILTEPYHLFIYF